MTDAVSEGTLLWQPSTAQQKASRMADYLRFLTHTRARFCGLRAVVLLVDQRARRLLGVDCRVFRGRVSKQCRPWPERRAATGALVRGCDAQLRRECAGRAGRACRARCAHGKR